MAIQTGSAGPDGFGSQLCRALGLPKNVMWLELRVAVNEPVTVRAGIVPDFESGDVVELLKRYELTEKVE